MEQLTRIVEHLEPERNVSQTTLAERLNISDLAERREALAEIFYRDRASHQYEGREPEDLDLLVQTVIPQTRSIPLRYLPECYVVALEQRKPEDNFQIRGVELLNAWKVIQGRVEMESKGAYTSAKLLNAINPRSCLRCYGTGKEEMPDGTSREGCEHLPMDEEEQAERHRLQQERIAFLRAEAKKIGTPKPPTRIIEPKPKGVQLKCDSCGRKVDTIFGFEEGGKCGDLLNRGTHDGPLKFCEGRFTELFTPS